MRFSSTPALPKGDIAKYRPSAMSVERIHQIGTIASLNDGFEATVPSAGSKNH